MASISYDSRGYARVMFVGPEGKRHSIRLGKVVRRSADTVRLKVEDMLAAKRDGMPLSNDTAAW